MNDDAPDFAAGLARRGLRLAQVSRQDKADNERDLAGYRQYVQAHPDDARKLGVREPAHLSEEQIVLVAFENHQRAVYLFNQVLTAGERGELRKYFSTFDRSKLPDVRSAGRELENAAAQPVATALASTPASSPDSTMARAGEIYLSLQDLERRWVYTRQGLYKVIRGEDFPPPCFSVNPGRTRIWALADIEAYEREHPEMRDEARKIFKVRGYIRTLHRVAKAERRFAKAGAGLTGW